MIALILLGVQAVLIGILSWKTSPNKTEVGHLGAAVYFRQTGKFDVFHVNPPLTRIVAGLPIALFCSPKYDFNAYSPRPQDRCEWPLGKAFIAANDLDDLRRYVFLARMACLPLVLLGGWFGCRFANELYGPGAGIVFLLLWVFSPLVLGWSATICPDVAAASMGIVGLYTFWHWLKTPTWKMAMTSGLCLGLMLMTKMTWIVAVPIWMILYVSWNLLRKEGESQAGLSQFVIILLAAWYVVNMGYFFDGSFRRLDDYQFISGTLTGQTMAQDSPIRPGNRFAGTMLGRLPVPLPKEFVLGIDTQKLDFERGLESYAMGKYSDRGWWWYYAYLLLLKEPLATWGLLLLALFAAGYGVRLPLQNELLLWVPMIGVFVFLSGQTGFSLHPRYVILVLPLLYLWISRLAVVFSRRRPVFMSLTAIFLLLGIGSGLFVFPNTMAYTNILGGGHENAPKHLLGSNIDWGQNVYLIRDWRQKHPEANPLYVTYTQSIPLDTLKLDGQGPIPTKPTEGWMLLGVNERFDRTGRYDWLDDYRPIEILGGGIWVYRIDWSTEKK